VPYTADYYFFAAGNGHDDDDHDDDDHDDDN
jgi:hypothetical protein